MLVPDFHKTRGLGEEASEYNESIALFTVTERSYQTESAEQAEKKAEQVLNNITMAKSILDEYAPEDKNKKCFGGPEIQFKCKRFVKTIDTKSGRAPPDRICTRK